MIDVVLFFLAVSLILYAVLGGADFGAGIIELSSSKAFRSEHRRLITKAIGPVWEANHVWLILAVVISFTAFPVIFKQLSISFHIPMTLLLLGITVRGCAFTFRHYDAIKDESQKAYTFLFLSSSLLTPLILGMIAGSMSSGLAIENHEGLSWYEYYIAPWLNGHSFAVGLFTVGLFAYIAAVYLASEAESSKSRQALINYSRTLGILNVVLGLIVFSSSLVYELQLLKDFFKSPPAMGCMALATLIFPFLHRSLIKQHLWTSRILVSLQISAIVIGWFAIYFPIVLKTSTGGFNAYTYAAPDATLKQLVVALIFGSILIFPALCYLFYIFKAKKQQDS